MWRFWNCVPRFVRQQFHGPRASAGVYVEEEKAEHEVDKFVQNEYAQEGHEATDGDSPSRGCRRGRRRSSFGCRFRSQWRQRVDQSEAKDEAHHERGYRRREHCRGPFWSHYRGQEGPLPEEEGSDWWKRHCHQHFWSRFCSQHHTLEAATWGAAVVLGLQLSRKPHLQNFLEFWKDPDKRQRWRGLLFQVAFAMPPDAGVSFSRSIVQGSATQKQDTEAETAADKNQADQDARDLKVSEFEDKKTLSDVMKDFESSCRQYTAVASSVSGLCAVERGQLTTAVEHLQVACRLGHAPAYFNLALCYEMGLGVEKDPKQAASYYHRAAEVGHAQSIFNLALMTLRGEGGIAKDQTKAMELLNQAAKQGLAQAQIYLGVYYTENEDDQQDFEQAASFFKAAASQNDAEGQYFLGICYENGWGVESSDEEAARLYSAAAEQGHDGAMYNLAAFHEYGLGGITCDEEEAMTLYKHSADSGNESAKFRLQEVEARQAVSLWSEQSNKTELVQSPGLRRTSHSSSPTFTDYVQDSIMGVWGGELTAWFSSQSLNSVSKPTDSQSPSFLLGGYDIGSLHGAADAKMNSSLLDISQQVGAPDTCFVSMPRTSTMPDLRMVSCQ